MISNLVLSQEQAEQIVQQAREGKPEEICGILRGRDGVVLEVVRGNNVAEERIENYTVDPMTLLKQFAFEEAGDAMIAIYHSHPVSEAYPSATDAWNAHYPDVHYLICSLEDDDAPVLRSFFLIAHYLDDVAPLEDEAERFSEVRDGLFGYYQPEGVQIPAGIAPMTEDRAAPFYVVFNRGEDRAIEEGRVVEVREAEVQIR